MATVPTVPLLAAGYVVTAADMNNLVTAAQFLYNGKPIALVHGNANQAVSNMVRTTINFPVKNYDTDGMWSSGANNKLTIQTQGYYRVRYSIPISGSPTDGGCFVTTGANNPAGSGVVEACWPGTASGAPPGSQYNTVSAEGVLPFYMYVGDAVAIQCICFDTLMTTNGTDEFPFLSLEWVAS